MSHIVSPNRIRAADSSPCSRPRVKLAVDSLRQQDSSPQLQARSGRRRAFSMAETLMSVVLVGGLLVVSLRMVGASVIWRQSAADVGIGELLAQDLMTEILIQRYEEPVDAVTFGRESGESGGDRSLYDDVDDYDGWSSTPPELRDGTALAHLAGWTRKVRVVFADPDDPNVIVGTDQGVKRIDVTASTNGLTVASLTALRNRATDLSQAN